MVMHAYDPAGQMNTRPGGNPDRHGEPSPGPRILLVEDSPPVAASVSDSLRRKGYRVTWVQDGFQAIHVFVNEHPDAIVMDLMLPYMNGTASTRQIRWEDPDVPIVGISGLANSEMVREFLAAGGSAFVDKRQLAPDLLNTLDDLMDHDAGES